MRFLLSQAKKDRSENPTSLENMGYLSLSNEKLRARNFSFFFVPNKVIQTTLRPIRWESYGKGDTF